MEAFDLCSELYMISDTEFGWSSYMQTTTIQLTAIVDSIFKSEVIVTDSLVHSTDLVNPYRQAQNTYTHSSLRKENIAPNAQVYFNLKKNHEMEIHCLRCIFLDNFVPFNSIFTSSGDDSLDSSEQYIFIRNWNLICTCWRLKDPYENGIVRNTFATFEKSEEEYPKKISSVETRPSLPYQEFKKMHKSVQIQYKKPAPAKTAPLTEIYSSRNISSINTSFKYPTATATKTLAIIPDDKTSNINVPKENKDIIFKVPFQMPGMDLIVAGESANANPVNKIIPRFEVIINKKIVQKDLDSLLCLQRIPGTVSDSLYERNNSTMKSVSLSKSTKDSICISSTEFSNTNLMLVENTLVAVNNDMEEVETPPLSPMSTSSSGWASNVNVIVNSPVSLMKDESVEEPLTPPNTETSTSSENKSLFVYSQTAEEKEVENLKKEKAEAGVIAEKVIANQNNKISIVPSETSVKHKSMFSWLKKHPIKQSLILKYLFRGIGFGIASFGTKPKRIGYTMDRSSMKRKSMSFKFKNRFVAPNKVVPIDAMSFGKSVVHEKLFKKRTVRRNPKSQKIIQNFEVQNFLPVKILKHNRVIPLPKITDPK